MTTLLALMLLLSQSPQPPKLDLNTSTKAQLVALDEGITPEIADAIIKGRPYPTVERVHKVVPKDVYERIQFKLKVERGDRPPIPRAIKQIAF